MGGLRSGGGPRRVSLLEDLTLIGTTTAPHLPLPLASPSGAAWIPAGLGGHSRGWGVPLDVRLVRIGSPGVVTQALLIVR
jgi:hypothetical protein